MPGRLKAIAAAMTAIGILAMAGQVHAAAGSPPSGPIEAPKDGADLKHACGQSVDGFAQKEGEQMLRAMLIVQCTAAVNAIVDMVEAGEYKIDGREIWKCLDDKSDREKLVETFVTWVGRRPQLLRLAPAVAFVEAVEMSARCRN